MDAGSTWFYLESQQHLRKSETGGVGVRGCVCVWGGGPEPWLLVLILPLSAV